MRWEFGCVVNRDLVTKLAWRQSWSHLKQHQHNHQVVDHEDARDKNLAAWIFLSNWDLSFSKVLGPLCEFQNAQTVVHLYVDRSDKITST